MKAVITGSNGFIGSHLSGRLARGGWDVISLVRPGSDTHLLNGSDVTIRSVSYADGNALASAIEGSDCLFHVAGLTRGRSAREYTLANTELTGQLLDVCLRLNTPPKRFVYLSSLTAAGPSPGEPYQDETCTPRPVDDYGSSKLAAERLLTERASGIPVTIIRPPAVFGPGDRNLLPLFRTARRLRAVPVVGRPSRRISFVDVRDLVEGILLSSAASTARGRIYYIAGGTRTMRDISETVAEALSIPPRIVSLPPLLARLAGEFGELKWTLTGKPQILSRRKIRDMLRDGWTCDWSKAGRELDYRPRFQLRETMRDTADWYRRTGLL
ncbi:MAG: NAD-dependent epimerase/dehydratase family protein [Kiritimatiellia bacterium]